ncbi:DNA polymerase III subunit gamma/tau [Thermoactinomyces mirandus]|uniref:DNA-directed DNA polymerase n=1 Tax=Thermoactinomyces mirandus TaxID=2756294 RepID=A0A7W2AQI9_9BACL|nr:DNA polymerase III subunit gamma/tau [Thermoactinomyces mirandus]
MSYRALYRVWRPQRFEDLVGQEHVTKTLMNALNEKHLSHAYLFSGPRGTGKTSAAKILAKAVNCVHGPAKEPCNECEACRRITDGSLMDVVEIDAASNRGVDEIRDLRDKVKYAPTEVRYKVYIIDEVHMLTTEAFNALLKTLEEPPEHVIFILATTEPHKLPPTIVSRCQRFPFRRISFEQIVKRMKHICQSMQISFDEEALLAIARAADGGMRDALSLLDQVLAFSGESLAIQDVQAVTGSISRELVLDMLMDLANQDASSALEKLDQCIVNGIEPENLIQDFIHTCRDLLLFRAAPQLIKHEEGEHWIESVEKAGQKLTEARLTQMMELLIHFQQQMKWVTHPRVLLEMALVRLAGVPESDQSGASQDSVRKLELRIRQLENTVQQLKNGSLPREEIPPPQKTRPAPSGPRVSNPALGNAWLRQLSEKQLSHVRKIWPDLLHRIKEEKITVHAWLIDGEPVGATKDAVIVAFKSKIHRETTDKESNKSLIEDVLSKTMGTRMRLKTIMVEDWEKIARKLGPRSSETESHAKESKPKREHDIVKKAVDLFGKDVVKILDDHKPV